MYVENEATLTTVPQLINTIKGIEKLCEKHAKTTAGFFQSGEMKKEKKRVLAKLLGELRLHDKKYLKGENVGLIQSTEIFINGSDHENYLKKVSKSVSNAYEAYRKAEGNNRKSETCKDLESASLLLNQSYAELMRQSPENDLPCCPSYCVLF